jgi:hypothetical protein
LPPALTREEVAYLRTEFLPRFGSVPRLGDGILLRSWKSGTPAGSPRLPPAIKSLSERGLIEVRRLVTGQPFRAFLTASGREALVIAIRNGKSFHPGRYAHLIEELASEYESDDTLEPPL